MGLIRFIHPDGEERIIRNYGSRSAPNGRVTKVSERKVSRGGGSDGRRATYEDLSTYGSDQRKFGAAMSRANQVGNQGDHTRDASRIAHGVKGRPERRRRQHLRVWRDAKLPTGNDVNNVSSLTPDNNTRVKPNDTRKLDNHLKDLDKKNPPNRRNRMKPGSITGRNVTPRSGTIKMGSNYMRPPVAFTQRQLRERNIEILRSQISVPARFVQSRAELIGHGIRFLKHATNPKSFEQIRKQAEALKMKP